ncbi:MAG: TrbI/VirB10 family protein [Alphaproteobacteria bacterium]|jgi:type IV secretion system protein TrbI|uniref:TrbI/VirB10 family protein n=1 Tax=Brevundimonas aurifodinae TaxID=1508312 RepID=A0ABV1NKA2_9CAUL|nr:TrbI/VirB10 family protein [Alphaproteobacteria bacterium]MBU2124502.1 TrbI/VirB10 family protein [Alphaproteobacteria bacterium]MBU2209753.1 TrbI/VirB10 family protein [Alphaproteobacteria bacterium]MBU2291857.1 TrbI/VirB10 family protein [Alphaproteobacteria bacterium]MBU2398467.1 TrbI/VirB10 family protein [Alphaproteobacteria bacterium]
MTGDLNAGPSTPDPTDAGPGVGSLKEPAPGLSMRAPRPAAVRLRKSVVQVIVIGGVVLISGSLAWAFVVQPELRDGARARAAEAREDEARGVVRPAEVVTDQPASYDRLPEPRGHEGEEAVEPVAEPVASPRSTSARAYRSTQAAAARGPTPRELAARSGLFFAESAGAPAAASAAADRDPGAGGRGQAVGADYGATYNGHVLTAPLSPYELKAGAMIPAALLTAVDTARAGPVIATVTQNIYDSVSGRHLVIPQGTRLIGRHEGESAYGDRRAFLTWDRLILPNGKSLVLTGEPGVDAQGAVGVRGSVDRRLFPLLVGTLFAGAITTLGQIARDGDDRSGSLLGDAGDAAAIEGARVGGRLIDRELEVRPSIRLRAGAPVRVMITRDLILEPYRP